MSQVRKTREAHPTKTIIAGNVVTGEMVEELVLSGADIIKIGIGPGSVCTTRYGIGTNTVSFLLVLTSAVTFMYMQKADGRGLSPAVRHPRVRRRSARPGRSRDQRRRLHLPRRLLQGKPQQTAMGVSIPVLTVLTAMLLLLLLV